MSAPTVGMLGVQRFEFARGGVVVVAAGLQVLLPAPAATGSPGSTSKPLNDARGVTGLVAFYNERVDVSVDGVTQERPRTPWGRARRH